MARNPNDPRWDRDRTAGNPGTSATTRYGGGYSGYDPYRGQAMQDPFSGERYQLDENGNPVEAVGLGKVSSPEYSRWNTNQRMIEQANQNQGQYWDAANQRMVNTGASRYISGSPDVNSEWYGQPWGMLANTGSGSDINNTAPQNRSAGSFMTPERRNAMRGAMGRGGGKGGQMAVNNRGQMNPNAAAEQAAAQGVQRPLGRYNPSHGNLSPEQMADAKASYDRWVANGGDPTMGTGTATGPNAVDPNQMAPPVTNMPVGQPIQYDPTMYDPNAGTSDAMLLPLDPHAGTSEGMPPAQNGEYMPPAVDPNQFDMIGIPDPNFHPNSEYTVNTQPFNTSTTTPAQPPAQQSDYIFSGPQISYDGSGSGKGGGNNRNPGNYGKGG